MIMNEIETTLIMASLKKYFLKKFYFILESSKFVNVNFLYICACPPRGLKSWVKV